MKIGVPKETMPGETRVGLVPETVGRLAKAGNTVVIERGAGVASAFPDDAYEKAGAQMVDNAFDAELVAKVQRPTDAEIGKLREGTVLIAFLSPLVNTDLARTLAERKVTALSMDAIPRITRAQPMDALSSQATVAGYKAVLLAASALPKFFPMLTTAAGTIAPAKARGSRASSWNRKVCATRPRYQAPTLPTASPVATSTPELVSTMRTTALRDAPSAIRTPISRVRCDTT